jgi:hypothetical protein
MSKQDFESPLHCSNYSNIESYGSFGYRPILSPVFVNTNPVIFEHRQPHKLPQFMQSKPRNEYKNCF